ncbi:hypothetical protein DSECCO2_222910 [anaerobic digester metagenome]
MLRPDIIQKRRCFQPVQPHFRKGILADQANRFAHEPLVLPVMGQRIANRRAFEGPRYDVGQSDFADEFHSLKDSEIYGAAIQILEIPFREFLLLPFQSEKTILLIGFKIRQKLLVFAIIIEVELSILRSDQFQADPFARHLQQLGLSDQPKPQGCHAEHVLIPDFRVAVNVILQDAFQHESEPGKGADIDIIRCDDGDLEIIPPLGECRIDLGQQLRHFLIIGHALKTQPKQDVLAFFICFQNKETGKLYSVFV